jgi:hypothetical protein
MEWTIDGGREERSRVENENSLLEIFSAKVPP